MGGYSYSTLDFGDLHDELVELRGLGDERDEHENIRLAALEALAEEVGSEDLIDVQGYPFVREGDFADFIAEDVPQIVEIPDFIQPYVDWEAVASDCRMDYSSVEFEGETWLYRD